MVRKWLLNLSVVNHFIVWSFDIKCSRRGIQISVDIKLRILLVRTYQYLQITSNVIFLFRTVLREGLKTHFAKVKVNVVECPDLRNEPFHLAAEGTYAVLNKRRHNSTCYKRLRCSEYACVLQRSWRTS